MRAGVHRMRSSSYGAFPFSPPAHRKFLWQRPCSRSFSMGRCANMAGFTSASQGLHPAPTERAGVPQRCRVWSLVRLLLTDPHISPWGRGTCALATLAQVRNQWPDSYSSLPWCPANRFSLSQYLKVNHLPIPTVTPWLISYLNECNCLWVNFLSLVAPFQLVLLETLKLPFQKTNLNMWRST